MNFSKKRLRIAGLLLGMTMFGSIFAGCGGEEAANSDEIKIGANFEMTGNVANYGTTTLEGLKLAIKEANDAGGINGKKITLVEADNKSDPAEAANAATKLISDDKVVAIVGPATSGAVQAESQVATENKVPIIAPDATSPDITVENGQVKPFVFRGCFIDPLQSNTMAAFAANELKAKTAVIYLDSSTDYSKSLAEVFKNKFEAEFCWSESTKKSEYDVIKQNIDNFAINAAKKYWTGSGLEWTSTETEKVKKMLKYKISNHYVKAVSEDGNSARSPRPAHPRDRQRALLPRRPARALFQAALSRGNTLHRHLAGGAWIGGFPVSGG